MKAGWFSYRNLSIRYPEEWAPAHYYDGKSPETATELDALCEPGMTMIEKHASDPSMTHEWQVHPDAGTIPLCGRCARVCRGLPPYDPEPATFKSTFTVKSDILNRMIKKIADDLDREVLELVKTPRRSKAAGKGRPKGAAPKGPKKKASKKKARKTR